MTAVAACRTRGIPRTYYYIRNNVWKRGTKTKNKWKWSFDAIPTIYSYLLIIYRRTFIRARYFSSVLIFIYLLLTTFYNTSTKLFSSSIPDRIRLRYCFPKIRQSIRIRVVRPSSYAYSRSNWIAQNFTNLNGENLLFGGFLFSEGGGEDIEQSKMTLEPGNL